MALHAALHRPPWQSRRIHWPPPHAHHEITRQQARRPAPRTHAGLAPVGGDGFRNLHPIAAGCATRQRRARRSRLPVRRQPPRADRPAAFAEPARGVARQPQSGLRATWLGHSTVLIEIDGLRVLTDPVWGAARVAVAAARARSASSRCRCALRALPPLDVVLVSHDHYDHLDYPTIRALAKTRRALRHLARRRRAPRGLGRRARAHHRARLVGDAHAARQPSSTVTAAPSQHFSGRGLKDRNATLWSSLVIRSAAAPRVLQRRHRPDRPSTRRSASASARSTW